jgi:2-oxoglutarate ferredoxin oxidoreductase subunit alpha
MALYASWEKDAQVEEYMVEDAEIVIAAYGISARVSKSAVDTLRREGIKVGLIRPITVHPFPYKAFDNINYDLCKNVVDVEMSIPAQFLHDVEKGVKERCSIDTCLCSGGNIMSREAIITAIKKINEN